MWRIDQAGQSVLGVSSKFGGTSRVLGWIRLRMEQPSESQVVRFRVMKCMMITLVRDRRIASWQARLYINNLHTPTSNFSLRSLPSALFPSQNPLHPLRTSPQPPDTRPSDSSAHPLDASIVNNHHNACIANPITAHLLLMH